MIINPERYKLLEELASAVEKYRPNDKADAIGWDVNYNAVLCARKKLRREALVTYEPEE